MLSIRANQNGGVHKKFLWMLPCKVALTPQVISDAKQEKFSLIATSGR